MPRPSETDYQFIRAIRPSLGEEWSVAKERILARLPEELDPKEVARYVDTSANPTISLNAYGVEPRFYTHRTSRRLLEFYPSK